MFFDEWGTSPQGKQVGNKQWLRSRRTQMAIVYDLRSQGVTSARTIKRAGHPDAPWWRVASNINRSVAVAVARVTANT